MSNEKDKEIGYLSPRDILNEKAIIDCNILSRDSRLTPRKSASNSQEKDTKHSTRSPRDLQRDLELSFNYNSDATASTYTLQVALKNMKERYHKLQKKISLLEEENTRLIDGKSELFGEIGKMQENSIKLREKNLQLNHEIHSKHKECCSNKEKYTDITEENIRLTTQLSQSCQEKKKLLKQVDDLSNENTRLKEGVRKTLSRHKITGGVTDEVVAQLEELLTNCVSENVAKLDSKTKIFPLSDDFKSLDDIEQLNDVNDDSVSLESAEKAKKSINAVIWLLREQKGKLLSFSPLFQNIHKNSQILQDDDACSSRLATCGSVVVPSGLSAPADNDLSPVMSNSGGETNILIEGVDGGGGSPFDWRKVQISDDEESVESERKPSTRTVSTSPDTALYRSHSPRKSRNGPTADDDGDRTCPMCNAIFPSFVPQTTFEGHVVSHFEVENGFEVVH